MPQAAICLLCGVVSGVGKAVQPKEELPFRWPIFGRKGMKNP